MSSFRVLAIASEGLRRLLWNAVRVDPVTLPLVGTEDAIVFVNPTATAQDSSRRLSLWLYHVSEDEHVKNAPPVRLDDASTRMTPLALDLYYLLTPFTGTGEADHLLLGKAMQTLHDTGIARVVDEAVGDVNEELRITLYRRSLDEISQVWQALREPYRLSVCYQVKVTHIDSLRAETSAHVVNVSGAWWQEPVVAGAL